MLRSDFHFDLPPGLIAAHPSPERGGSRLLVVRRDSEVFEHRRFDELDRLLRPGDCLVLNDSRVIPARLHLARPSGAPCELLLLEERPGKIWEAMVRPAKKLRPGLRLDLPGGRGQVEILEGGGDRTRPVRFDIEGDVLDFLERHGEVPLPPYILNQRKVCGEEPSDIAEDHERYQTVYAQSPGSVAAPTAGLHFTPEMLTRLETRGVEIRRVTLHVGAGTFEPITAERLEDHVMHYERYSIGEEAAGAIEAARLDPERRVVAVGTTSVRTLEACFSVHGRIQAASETTNLFIYPGRRFHVIDAMVTNFHLPESTLLVLVSALAGREKILSAYREAIAHGYRFYSYGDAMLIE